MFFDKFGHQVKILSIVFFIKTYGAATVMASPQTGKTASCDFNFLIHKLPRNLDSRLIETAARWTIMRHIGYPYLYLSKSGQIQGGLFKSWKISEDFKTYEFEIDQNQKFSDGSSITTDDVLESLLDLKQQSNGVHFDFNKFSKMEKTSDTSLQIVLKEPIKNFLDTLISPEFMVVHKSDRGVSIGQQTFKVSSGAFKVKSHSEDKLILEKNPHFPLGAKDYPCSILIHEPKNSESILANIKKSELDSLDFAIDKKFYEAAEENEMIPFIPRISQTIALTLNAQNGPFSDFENRKIFQSLIKSTQIDFSEKLMKWDVADQLFLPGGEGRIRDKELKKFWEERKKTNVPKGFLENITLRIAYSDKYDPGTIIVDKIKKLGFKVKPMPLSGEKHRQVLLNKNSYDIYISTNDYASDDVRSSLIVAFSKDMPMILLEDNSEVKKLLGELQSVSDNTERHLKVRQIGTLLLKNANIVPIIYDHNVHYFSKKWDVSQLSTIFPDYSLWKVKLK